MKPSSVLLPILSSLALSAMAASPLVVYDVSASGASGNLGTCA